MQRRNFMKYLCASTISLSSVGRVIADSNNKKPNILFIFTDDQTYETVQALGYNEVLTPNIDRLVKKGVTFSNCYNQGSYSAAVCVASRTMLNTGRFLWNAWKKVKSLGQEVAAGHLWSQYIKSAGYDTYLTGKWHVPRANAKAIFDITSNIRGGMPKQTPQGYNRPIEGKNDQWKPWYTHFGGYWKGGRHWSEVVGSDADRFIKEVSKKENPFFMYVAFNAPHDPRQSPKEYVNKYPLDNIKVPENYLDLHPYMDYINCHRTQRDESLAPHPRTHYAVKVHRQEYYSIITHMDAQVGRILDSLEESGKMDNTYIFFTSDHGLAVGHHGLMGKQNLYNHSLKVPFIVCGPGIPEGEKISAPIYLQDVMPTTLELAGVRIPDHVQFKSVMPLIEKKQEKTHDAVYGAFRKSQRTVIIDNYKLMMFPEVKKYFLYDIKNDSQEMTNLAGDPQYDTIIEKLFNRFLLLQKETGDTQVKIDIKQYSAGPKLLSDIEPLVKPLKIK